MKKKYFILVLICSLFLSACNIKKQHLKEANSLTKESPYFGQKTPGLIPEIFAPGIISISGRSEMGVSFSPDLDEMYFTIQQKSGVPADIYFSKLEDEKWTSFKKANFTKGKKAGEMEPNVSYDGKKIYFTAYNADFTDTSIWYVNRLNNGWSTAIKLDSPLNKHQVMTSTLAKNGDLYYTNITKKFETYYAPNINGKYPKFQKAEIEFGGHAFISPSQDYLIVDARNKEDKNQNVDLYVYFKKKDGAWTKPINLGSTVNSTFDETVATVTPDGKYLIFSRRSVGRELNLYWVSTEVIENLRPKNNEEPKPTSNSIAYSSIESGNVEIYQKDAEGKLTTKSTNEKGGYLAWSPNGKRFAFYYKYDEKKTWSIHIMNSDGTNRKRLTHEKNKWDNSPAWSPDGTKIVFSRAYKDVDKNWLKELWIMNSDGSQQSQIKSLNGGGPYFTQDGRIVFHSELNGEKSKISIADIDGNNIIHLTDNEAEEQHPEVSPDGKKIAFMSDRDGNHEIYVMNIDGSNQKRLTNNDVDDWYPSWSPDGSQLIFSSLRDGEKSIYVMNKDGSSVRKIIPNATSPAWLKITK